MEEGARGVALARALASAVGEGEVPEGRTAGVEGEGCPGGGVGDMAAPTEPLAGGVVVGGMEPLADEVPAPGVGAGPCTPPSEAKTSASRLTVISESVRV